MQYKQSRQAYQAVAGDGATQASLTQHVYEFLAQDLLRAAEAVRGGNIEARCAASNHALLLLGHLESWLEVLQDEPLLAESLRSFYTVLRVGIIQAQGLQDASALEQAAQNVLDTREAWQLQQARLSQKATIGLESEAPRITMSFCA